MASQVYGVVPPVASSVKGVTGASTIAVCAPGSVADSGASPAVVLVGVGTPTVKSAELSSVSAPWALRATDVAFAGAGAAEVSKLAPAPWEP